MNKKEITTKNFSRGMIFTKSATTQEDLNKYIIRGVFSTPDTDRHEEIVDQQGWDLKDYQLNPVVLFNHDHSIPAIAKMIELHVGVNGLEGAMQFAVEESEFAKEIFGLYVGGFMSAFSCGFINDVYEYDQVNDKIVLKENRLLEVSCVNVPANARALAKTLGMSVKAIEKAYPCAENDAPKQSETDQSDCGDGCDCDECGKIDVEVTTDSPGDEVVTDQAIDEAQESVKRVLSNITKADSRKSLTKRDVVLMINKSINELLKAKKQIRK